MPPVDLLGAVVWGTRRFDYGVGVWSGMNNIVKPGERFIITRVEYPDPDMNCVVYYGAGFAFPSSQAWMEREKPVRGKFIEMGYDNHWRVRDVA